MGRRSRPKEAPHVPIEWPEPSLEPRVLIEDPDESSRWAKRRLLERSGFEVGDCPGPGADGWTCPIPRGETCALVEGADAVVVALNPRDGASREIVAYHKRHIDERPGCLEWTAVEVAAARDDVEGFRVVGPSGLGDLVGALTAALRGRPDRNGDGATEH